MPARIDERTQFVDSAGTPIVNGKIYIGLQNADPKLNLITIYSDRALTIPLANPQLTDAEGRSVNKIWIPGDYSIQVDNSLDVQQLLDLDAGVTVEVRGVTPLTNTAGTNTITAEGTPTVLSYLDGQLYSFQAVNNNTGPVTLNIDGVGAKSITKNLVTALEANDIQANSMIVVIWNENQDIFEWINQNTVTLENTLLNTLQPTGLMQSYMGLTAPAGWVLADGGSIGNAASGATNRANADTEALFTLIYNSMADPQAPVSGGRGAGAAADFALNKNITIPDLRGKSAFGRGGVKPAIQGDSGGLEDVTLTIPEIPPHDHDFTAAISSSNLDAGPFPATILSGTTQTTMTGGGNAHENMPPWVSVSYVIKL